MILLAIASATSSLIGVVVVVSFLLRYILVSQPKMVRMHMMLTTYSSINSINIALAPKMTRQIIFTACLCTDFYQEKRKFFPN